MLDVILDSLGAALLFGQAIHFCWFAEGPVAATARGRSVVPESGPGRKAEWIVQDASAEPGEPRRR